MTPARRSHVIWRSRTALLVATLLLFPASGQGGRERLALRYASLDLPAAPAKVVSADVDGDGLHDLVVVVAYTEFREIGEDRIEGMVQITTVIPALFDRRELRVYHAVAAGQYELLGGPVELPTSVLHLEPGPPGLPVVALTDDGLSRLIVDPSGDADPIRLEPVLADPPILAGTKSFYGSLELVEDLDGDGTEDVLMPSRRGLSIYLGGNDGLATEPAERIQLPATGPDSAGRTQLRYPLPDVGHVDGDDLPDLVFPDGLGGSGPRRTHVLLGSGGGRFAALRVAPLDCHDDGSDLRVDGVEPMTDPWPRDLATLRDLDGDRRAEAVFSVTRQRGEGLRAGLKDAKKPIQAYGFHELTEDLFVAPSPYFEMEVVGHTVDADLEEEGLPFRIRSFQDLDNDGLEDLVSVTLDFSILQAVKILATKKIGIGLDFHVYNQHADGSFHEVTDLDLSEKLKLDLNNLKLGRFAQFAGDFDGDGRQDFVHLGRGRRITLHRGQPGCRFPRNPDLVIELDEEPPTLDLVKIQDLDGDGRSDLMITRPLPLDAGDVSDPVRLDLYLSGGGS